MSLYTRLNCINVKGIHSAPKPLIYELLLWSILKKTDSKIKQPDPDPRSLPPEAGDRTRWFLRFILIATVLWILSIIFLPQFQATVLFDKLIRS